MRDSDPGKHTEFTVLGVSRYERSIAVANTRGEFCISKSVSRLVHGRNRNHETIRVRTLYSFFAGWIVAESLCTSKSVPTSGPNGSSSGNPGPSYSSDIPDHENQSAAETG